jgi:hypothetical protein
MRAVAERAGNNATFLNEYRALEANGRAWTGPNAAPRDYACALR